MVYSQVTTQLSTLTTHETTSHCTLQMKRLHLGDKILLFQNVYYIIFYLVIVALVIFYNSGKIDFQMEKLRQIWILKAGESP